MKYPFFKKTLPILLGIFFLSVLIRVPTLDRPLSKHHEFCTAVSLRVMEVWNDGGIGKYGWNPVMTYTSETDKYINNHANTSGQMIDDDGNYYYISHPPLAYYLPYFCFKLFGQEPSVLGLQIFNLLCHFLSALFIYFLANLLGLHPARGKTYIPGLVAFTIYIFAPATMWFQSNVYMSDMLVQTFFIFSIYATLKFIIRKRFMSPKYLVSLGVLSFCMAYTSWLGIVYTIVVAGYASLKLFKEKKFAILFLVTVIPTVLAVLLTLYQYGQINGISAYVEEALMRYKIRGSFNVNYGVLGNIKLILHHLKQLLVNYAVSYLPIYLLMGGFFWLAISSAKLKIVFSRNGYRFLILAGITIVALHLIFLNYSGHDFSTLYGSVFLSVLIGMLYDKMKYTKVLKKGYLNIIIALTVSAMVAQYFFINRPGEISLRGDRYDYYEEIAWTITKESNENEVIFVQNYDPEPQLIYYAERNMKKISEEKEAYEFIRDRGIDKGVIYTFDERGEIIGTKHILAN